MQQPDERSRSTDPLLSPLSIAHNLLYAPDRNSAGATQYSLQAGAANDACSSSSMESDRGWTDECGIRFNFQSGTKTRPETPLKIEIQLHPSRDGWKWLRIAGEPVAHDLDQGDTLYLSADLQRSSQPGVFIHSCLRCQSLQRNRDSRRKDKVRRQVSENNDSPPSAPNPAGAACSTPTKGALSTTPIIVFKDARKKQIRDGRVLVFPRVTCSSSHHGKRQAFELVFTIKDSQGNVVACGTTPRFQIVDSRPHNRRAVTRGSDHSTNGSEESNEKPPSSSLEAPSSEGSPLPFLTPHRQGSESPLEGSHDADSAFGSNNDDGEGDQELSNPDFVNLAPEFPGHDVEARIHVPPQSLPQAGDTVPLSSFVLASQLHQASASSTSHMPPADNNATDFLPNQEAVNSAPDSLPPRFPPAINLAPPPGLYLDINEFYAALCADPPISDPTPSQTSLPPPHILRINPRSVPVMGCVEVDVIGSDFPQDTFCTFGDMPAPTEWFNASVCLCVSPPSSIAGTFEVKFSGVPAMGTTQFFTYVDTRENDLATRILKTAGWMLLGRDADVATIGSHLFNTLQNFPTILGWLNRDAPFHQAADVDLEVAAVEMLTLLDQSPGGDFMSTAKAVSLASSAGQTALHLSAALGFERLLKELLARGVDPDQRDANGYTPLHFAALFGHIDCARVLLRGGADADIVNATGRTALAIARDSDHRVLAELLETRTAKATEINDNQNDDAERHTYPEISPPRSPGVSPCASPPQMGKDRMTSPPSPTRQSSRQLTPNTSDDSPDEPKRAPPKVARKDIMIKDAVKESVANRARQTLSSPERRFTDGPIDATARISTPRSRGSSRVLAGCLCCRVRTKKCEVPMNLASDCVDCERLNIKCLRGFGKPMPRTIRVSAQTQPMQWSEFRRWLFVEIKTSRLNNAHRIMQDSTPVPSTSDSPEPLVNEELIHTYYGDSRLDHPSKPHGVPRPYSPTYYRLSRNATYPLQGRPEAVTPAASPPDGTRSVPGPDDDIIRLSDFVSRLRDAASGRAIAEPLQGHSNRARSAASSPDGTRTAPDSYYNITQSWNVASVTRHHEFLIVQLECQGEAPNWLRIDRRLGKARSSVTRATAIEERLRGHSGPVTSAAPSPDAIRLWNDVIGRPTEAEHEGCFVCRWRKKKCEHTVELTHHAPQRIEHRYAATGKDRADTGPTIATPSTPLDLASLFDSIGLYSVSPPFWGPPPGGAGSPADTPPTPNIGVTTRSDIGGGTAAPIGRRRGWSASSSPWVRTKHKRGISGGPRTTALSISAPASPTSQRLGNSSANLNGIHDSADDDDGEGDKADDDDCADHGSGSRRGPFAVLIKDRQAIPESVVY